MSKHPTYQTWKRMIARCYINSASHFNLYGGRGIRVCARWHSFTNFFSDMIGEWDTGLTLDRIDPDGNYQPANCRWATLRTQAQNRRCSLDIVFRGDTRKLAEVAEQFSSVDYPTVYQRVKTGWDTEKALHTPPQKDCKRKPFILNGIEYKTLRGCSRSLGIAAKSVVTLIKKGCGHYL